MPDVLRGAATVHRRLSGAFLLCLCLVLAGWTMLDSAAWARGRASTTPKGRDVARARRSGVTGAPTIVLPPLGELAGQPVATEPPGHTMALPPLSVLTDGAPVPPSPPAGQPFVKGIVTNLQGWGVSAVPKISSEMRTLGVTWAREDLSWAVAEPRPGVYDWSQFDQVVGAARASGIAILPIVGYAPPWTGPDQAGAYAEFVAAAVARYGPGTPANLRWWELWNEPYLPYAWSGKTPNPAAYARDVLAAAAAAKSVSAAAKVLVAADFQDTPQTGGSTPWETSWVDDMFQAAPSLGRWVDGVAVHPYGDDPARPPATPGSWHDAAGQWSFQRIDTIRARFLAHGVDLPFWITEEGWSTRDVSPAIQAHNYADLTAQIAVRPWIRALFPFCLREFGPRGTTSDQPQYGLLSYRTWTPKPAFYVLQSGLRALR